VASELPATNLTPEDIEANLKQYLGDRSDSARYASFDYCYNYFQSFYARGQLEDVRAPEHLQTSCLQLGFYLASWGMFRGASHLLQGSMKHYIPLLEVIAGNRRMFELDVPDYDVASIPLLRAAFDEVQGAFPHPATPTLVTKVMLGVFGCVPAFDTYFKAGFDASTFGPKSLRRIREFYDAASEVIERHRVPTLDFETGRDTHFRYTAAKVIDMIFFIEGLKRGVVT
jgi:hypothetical protein